MSFTYSPSLPSDRDWVRLLINDTDPSSPQFQDEEIDGMIADSSSPGTRGLKYFVAATALSSLLSRLSLSGEGVESIRIGSLTITQGVSGSGVTALQARISYLRKEGVRLNGGATLTAVGPCTGRPIAWIS